MAADTAERHAWTARLWSSGGIVRRRIVGVAVGLSVVAAACVDDSGSSTARTSTTAGAEPAASSMASSPEASTTTTSPSRSFEVELVEPSPRENGPEALIPSSFPDVPTEVRFSDAGFGPTQIRPDELSAAAPSPTGSPPSTSRGSCGSPTWTSSPTTSPCSSSSRRRSPRLPAADHDAGTRSSTTPSPASPWRSPTVRCATPRSLTTADTRVASSSSACPARCTTARWSCTTARPSRCGRISPASDWSGCSAATGSPATRSPSPRGPSSEPPTPTASCCPATPGTRRSTAGTSTQGTTT